MAVKLASPALQQVINDLQALRGVADISAVTIAAELGQVSRFESARQLMGYSGAVPSEDSSGKRMRRGSITKTGNAHLRRIVVEAAWSYRRPPCIWYGLRRRQESISEEAKEIVWKAQHLLHKRYMKLGAAGKEQSHHESASSFKDRVGAALSMMLSSSTAFSFSIAPELLWS
jgi:transposase